MAASSSLSAISKSIEDRTREFVSGYETAGKMKNAKYVSIHLAPDCKRFLASRAFLEAVDLAPGAPHSNAEYQVKYEKQMSIWAVKSTKIFNLTIDPERKRAAARTVGYGQFIDGEKHEMEFAYFLDFNDDGTHITKIVQYVDPTESLLFRTKAKELLEKMAAEKATEN